MYVDFLCRILSASKRFALHMKADAHQEDVSDFEDFLQEECAFAISADYIVTRNTKDFASSRVPAILPDLT